MQPDVRAVDLDRLPSSRRVPLALASRLRPRRREARKPAGLRKSPHFTAATRSNTLSGSFLDFSPA